MNVLFVCSRNRWRSLTAERLFQNKEGYTVRSAGTAADARIRITEKLILWADVIYVMEKKHRDILKERFPFALEDKQVIILDIEDNYKFMDAELVELLRDLL